MRKITFIFISVLFLSTAATDVKAQEPGYKTALGGRIGTYSGFSIKHHFNSLFAIDGTAGFAPYAFGVVGLATFNFHIPKVEYLTIFFGPGLDIITYYGRPAYLGIGNTYSNFGFGIDFTIGAEYTFQNIPLDIGLNFGPRYALNNTGFDYYGFSGIFARYTINR